MKLVRHRVVRDRYLGYECQVWKLWWPFWEQMHDGAPINTHSTLKGAIEFIKTHNKAIWDDYSTTGAIKEAKEIVSK